ncbi:hypothetical protein DSL72_001347 [Monilinia vaccinii-corymbosi]|uniref:Uncharacterized protein n=1 Tax=Monilinia vaccinii-corymbosi TaxID=61207 RepID=A0A8A3P982_9HELO|nr:hypothetical protein DSL72_001347 [Monilinia vaccinii-corymbosi]
MLPRARPVYPGPLRMTAEEHYEFVEARARITSGGNRIVCEDHITLNVDFGTVDEERHSEDCVCVVCRDVERVKMGRRTVITGGCGVVFRDGEGEEGWGDRRDESGEGAEGCADQKDESGEGAEGCADQKDESGEGEDESDAEDDSAGVSEQESVEGDCDSEHDGEVIFAGAGKMTRLKITKPHTPANLRKVKRIGDSSSTVHTDGLSSHSRSRSALSQHDAEATRDLSAMDSLGASGSSTLSVAISYSHSPSHSCPPSPGSAGILQHERGRSTNEELHATWDPLIKNKEGLASKSLGAIQRSLSKTSVSVGKDRGKGCDGSVGTRAGKVWNFARSLSRRSNNSGHSSQTRKDSKEDSARLKWQMDESGELEDHNFSFEAQESLHASFQGDQFMEHGEEGTPGAFIGPHRHPEMHNFPQFDPGQFVATTPASLNTSGRASGSDSNISTLDINEGSRSRSPSLRSRHYSSRGSFSVNWENISSDTVYHKHARRFYQNPASYGEEIPGYNPETDNPYLAYDRYQEVSEWTDGTEEVDPDHVVALTTRELKRLCGEEVKIPFDYIPEGYVNPPNSKANSISGDDDDDDGDTTITGDESDNATQPKHKNLIDLLGMPGWDDDWEEMTKMQRHFHIVAAGDWAMGPVFDVKSNYSSHYSMPLFEPDDAGCYGVNRRDVRGLQVPSLRELQVRFDMKESDFDDESGSEEEKDQDEHTDENVESDASAEYDSEGFLYDGDGHKVRKATGPSGPAGFTASEVERIFMIRRPSVGGEGSEEGKSGEASEAGEYAGSIVEGYGTTDDHTLGAGRFSESFRARMAQGGSTATGRFDQDLFTPFNPGSPVSEEDYDSIEEYGDDEGESKDYSFGNSSYHGTECQDDYVIGTSTFIPHAFQLYPPYNAANDVTTLGVTPDEVEAAHPPPWDADFMEDIMGYSVHESPKARDATAEMVLMSYLDPVAPDGSKSRGRASTGSSLTPIPSPTKSTKSSFITNFKALPRVFNKNKSLPPTPILGAPPSTSSIMAGTSTNTLRNISSLRKASLSTAHVAKIDGKSKGKGKAKKDKDSKGSNGKGRGKKKPPHVVSPPSETSSDSDSNTSYVDLTRTGSSFHVPPSQSLILYLYGHGLSVSHIAFLLQALSQDFLYDTATSWWPITSTPTASSASHVRLPPHHLFTPTTVQAILQHCAAAREWWEGPHAVDASGKKIPRILQKLKRDLYMRKAQAHVRKVLENFLFWRLRGERPHGNLMRG